LGFSRSRVKASAIRLVRATALRTPAVPPAHEWGEEPDKR
jgi:hypothetical protein